MKKILITILVLIVLGIVGEGLYWYFYVLNPSKDKPAKVVSSLDTGFSTFGDNKTSQNTESDASKDKQESTTTEEVVVDNSAYTVPKLHQISTTPVAGYVTSSTASSSSVRFVERGTGHVFEANNLSSVVRKISNTTLPKIYDAFGNNNGSQYVVRYLQENSDKITNFYTEMRSTGTTSSETPYELKGKYISPEIKEVAVSPTGDKIFTWNTENGKGVGYVSSFDEKGKVKIADLPFTLANIDWPMPGTVSITTKPSGVSSGFMYTVDTKTARVSKVLGGFRGLIAKMNSDGSRILFSSQTKSNFSTSVLNTKDKTSQEIIFKTLADKCIWSNFRKTEVYCAVPTETPDGVYPDDWYKGTVSFVDQIWYLNTANNDVQQIADLLKLSDKLIDATNLTLDPKDNFLYFINKRDLTLWALDLNQ